MNFLRQTSAGTKLAFSIVITGFCFLFFSFIALLLALPMFGISLAELYGMLQFFSVENVPMLKYMQGFQSAGLFVIPPILIALLLYNRADEVLYWSRRPTTEQLGMTLLLMLALFPVINVLAQWNAQMELPSYMAYLEGWMREKEDLAGKITLAFLQVDTWQGYLVNMLIIAIIPALGEEFLFRGVLQKQFSGIFMNKHVGAVLSALLFSAIHIQFYGFIPRFLLGLLFSYLLIWTGNIWMPVLAHLINNGTAVTFYFFADVEKIETQVETFGTDASTWFYTLFAALLVATVLYWFYKHRNEVYRC